MSMISIARCPSYEEDLPAVLDAVLAPLGGMSAFVSPGQTVLIKPNMLTDRLPEQAVTTHPELVRAVIRSVRDAGGIPSVGDSPASAVKIGRVMEQTGFVTLCQEESVPLIQFESAGSVTVKRDSFTFSIAKPVREADVVINMPKVKTHVLTTFTAAVKNTYGAVPGYQKALLHKRYSNPRDFGKLVWSIHQAVAPALHIADGIVGMEGAGPAGGTPVAMEFLAASSSGAAMDLGLCELLGIDPKAVPFLPPSINVASPISFELNDVHFAGKSVSPRSLALPSTFAARMIPSWITRLLEPFVWIRPAIRDTCIQCGKCVKSCPVDALSIEKGSKPELSPSDCIGCCCCHEICPAKAIEMTQSPLLNRIRRGKMP
jgi:uncharacterized protein (DUF362 family)/Pyruvate/2-oxoacid:ferredoxin oxidoreductase delta subunit